MRKQSWYFLFSWRDAASVAAAATLGKLANKGILQEACLIRGRKSEN